MTKAERDVLRSRAKLYVANPDPVPFLCQANEVLSLLNAIPEWRPMESAPKDGTEILLGWFHLPGQTNMDVGSWLPSRNRWQGHYIVFTDHRASQPTHWMPLPEVPDA